MAALIIYLPTRFWVGKIGALQVGKVLRAPHTYTARRRTLRKSIHGATVKVKVNDTKYRRSPLIQGGLEIPVEVEVQMENSSENQQALSKYKTLIAENYHEPVNGKYVDATSDILKALYSEDELTDFEDEGDEEVDTNKADLDSVVLETGSVW